MYNAIMQVVCSGKSALMTHACLDDYNQKSLMQPAIKLSMWN